MAKKVSKNGKKSTSRKKKNSPLWIYDAAAGFLVCTAMALTLAATFPLASAESGGWFSESMAGFRSLMDKGFGLAWYAWIPMLAVCAYVLFSTQNLLSVLRVVLGVLAIFPLTLLMHTLFAGGGGELGYLLDRFPHDTLSKFACGSASFATVFFFVFAALGYPPWRAVAIVGRAFGGLSRLLFARGSRVATDTVTGAAKGAAKGTKRWWTTRREAVKAENDETEPVITHGTKSPVNSETSETPVLRPGERVLEIERPVREAPVEPPEEPTSIIHETPEPQSDFSEEEPPWDTSEDSREPAIVEAHPTPPDEPNAGLPKQKTPSVEGEPEIVESRAASPDRDSIDRKIQEMEFSRRQESQQRKYELPSMQLLEYQAPEGNLTDVEELKHNARLLEEAFNHYGIDGKVTEIHPGPVITMYEYAPKPGIRISKIAGLEDDLAMTLAAVKVRIVAPIPGKSVVGIEVPNKLRETVYFKEMLTDDAFAKAKSKLAFTLGKNIFGFPVVSELSKMPHLLIAGTTGSGKSVAVNTMILSFLFRATPDEVKFIMVDPKRLEFNFYDGIPHLLLPVVTDPQQAALALNWVVKEMENRYDLLASWGVKNLSSFNKLADEVTELRETYFGEDSEEMKGDLPKDARAQRLLKKIKGKKAIKRLPLIVVIIDELADLMMVAKADVETAIARLAQMARAAGIHLIVATQRPSTDVLTGLIKNNFPARISFKVAGKVDSRTILDQNGAEALLGRGDMLYLAPGTGTPQRVHGSFVSESEIDRVVRHIRSQATFDEDRGEQLLQQFGEESEAQAEAAAKAGGDALYDKAIQIVCESGKASISMLQRRLQVGYNRAARMIEQMEEDGIVGPSEGVKGRAVYGRPKLGFENDE